MPATYRILAQSRQETKTITPRLYLHIGPPKTGTSAVQHVLRQHDDSVVYYPKSGLWRDGAHHNLAFNFLGDFSRPETEQLDRAALFDEIAEGARRTGKSVVISSELMYSRDLGPFLDALLGAIGASRDQAEIVLAYREPYARAASSYNQLVKDAYYREQRSPGQYLLENVATFLYAPRLAQLAELGVPVKILTYDSDFANRFLGHIGFPPGEIGAVESRNVSLSVKGLIATLAANRIATSQEHREQLFATLRRLRKFFAPSRFLFDAPSLEAVEPHFAKDRQAQQARWGFVAPLTDLASVRDEFHITRAEADEIDAVCQQLEPADHIAMRQAVASFIAIAMNA